MHLHIVRPSSKEASDLLSPRLVQLRDAGIDVEHAELPADPSWPYAAASAETRAIALQDCLTRPGALVVAARGGYGASDLLPLLDWGVLQKAPAQAWLIGFSDVSALHAALYAKLGWRSLHGPMPATSLWASDRITSDVEELLQILKGISFGKPVQATRHVSPVDPTNAARICSGPLFGGCFTVLTNLIGTPYFPNLAGHILFIEDTGESPARLMRAWNQWLQSGVVASLACVVIGHLRELGGDVPDCPDFLYREFQKRSPVPVYQANEFGHTTPNRPLMNGAVARIADGKLLWCSNNFDILGA